MKLKLSSIFFFVSLLSMSQIYSQSNTENPTEKNILDLLHLVKADYSLIIGQDFTQNQIRKFLALVAFKNNIDKTRFGIPLLKIFIMRFENSSWNVEYQNEDFANIGEKCGLGGWGSIFPVKLINLGLDEIGLIFEGKGGAQGSFYKSIRIMPYFQKQFHEGICLGIETIDQEDGLNYKVKYEFSKNSKNNFYDLVTIKNGTNYNGEGKKVTYRNEKEIYKLINGKYYSNQRESEFIVGNFKFNISKSEFKKEIGNALYKKEADGVYILVNLTVTNLTKEPRTLSGAMFKVFDDDNYEYGFSNDASGALELNKINTFQLIELPPQIPKKGTIVFEVPSKEKSYSLYLPGGVWSNEKKIIDLINFIQD